MFRIRSIKSAVAGALFLGLAAGTAHAALTPWQEEVAQSLENTRQALANYGFTNLVDAASDMIRQDDGFVRDITLRAGHTYAFAIACDHDCSDAVLQVYDQNGNAVGKTVKNLPVVQITPRWTGPFRIKVNLVKCRSEACEVGVASFSK